MNRFLMSFALVVLLTPSLWGQATPPAIGYVYPAGGQQGTTFEVKLGGQYFNQATGVQISGTGVTAKFLRQTKPLRPAEVTALRAKLQELTGKAQKTTAEQKEIETIREQLAQSAVPVPPVLAENVFLSVTIDSTAAPGPRELRLQAKTGMSNPIVFDIGQLPEIRQTKESFDPEARPVRGLGRFVKPKSGEPTAEVQVTLPAVLNSQLLPGEVDHYRFRAKKDQQLVFRTRARALIPYLADAVPGWIQTVLTLYDAEGKEVAFNDDNRGDPDPVLAYRVPRDGEYILEIHDAIYRGREDFVYRIEAGELPHITNIFPLGGQTNVPTEVTLEGWNLTQKSLKLEAQEMKQGWKQLSVRSGELMSNSVPFGVSSMTDCLEKEPNNSIAAAQKLSLPIYVNGRIEKPGDVDVFTIEGYSGQVIVAEVWARRLGSPLDSLLKLTDSTGRVLAFNDDQEDRGQGLMTHHADSRLQTTLPAAGTYYLHVSDTQRHGSTAHAYRLRVSPPRPDFELRVTPCSINARPGTTVPVTVYALRKDGFTGEINLFLTYKPVDFALSGARIPANQNEVRMTVQVPSTPRPTPIQLDVEGRAMVGNQLVIRPAQAAEDMMQAFIYHHLVPADHLMVTVSTEARSRFPARLLTAQPIKIRPGGSAVVQFAIPKGASKAKLRVVLNDPPEGITLKRSEFTGDGALLEIHADSDKVKPGTKTNLIAEIFPEAGKAGAQSRFPLGTFPAIPVQVIRAGR